MVFERELEKQIADLKEEINKIAFARGELEKENAELKADNDARKFAMAMSEKVEKQLREENAELKESNKMLEQGYIWHDYDAGEDSYEDTHEGKWVKRDEVYQLTKAKEIIKKLKALYFSPVVTKDDVKRQDKILNEAEQFLNSEVK